MVGATTYYVYRNGTCINAVAESNCTDVLTEDGTYCYTVAANYTAGNSSQSNSACVVVTLPPESSDGIPGFAFLWVVGVLALITMFRQKKPK